MKKNILTLLLFVCCSTKVLQAQVGMNTNNPHKSAALDMSGESNKGLLIPNISLVALDNPAPIVNNAPATGLMVYNNNATLPALNGQPGGTGYYYWDGAKWCRMLIPANLGADNLGNHTATDTLRMANNDIQNINKTSTQTESIAQGTDGLLPIPGYVVTSLDAQGNIVWRPAPFTVAKDTIAFYRESTGAVSITGQQSAAVAIPNLESFTYTATGSGTLMLQAVFYGQIESIASAPVSTVDCMARVVVYNGTTLVDEMYTDSKVVAFTTNKFPGKMVLQLLIPVVKGTTYTIKASGLTGYTTMPLGIDLPVSIGTLTTAGGATINSYIMGTLLGLAPLPGGFN